MSNKLVLMILLVIAVVCATEDNFDQIVNKTLIHKQSVQQNPVKVQQDVSVEQEISLEQLQRSNNDRSRSKNPHDQKYNPNTEDSTGGQSSLDSHKSASARDELVKNQPISFKYKSLSSEELKNSINDRSNAMNPNNRKFNPSSKIRSAKSSQEAGNKIKELERRSLKNFNPENRNLSPAQYTAIFSFVRAVLSKCYEHNKWDADCAYEVAKEVGVSTLFVTAINNLPLAQSIQRLYIVNNACVRTSGEQCVIACTKFVTSMTVSLASYSLTLGLLGPVIDGTAQYLVTDKLLDAVFDSELGNTIRSGANKAYDKASNQEFVKALGDGVDIANDVGANVRDQVLKKAEILKEKILNTDLNEVSAFAKDELKKASERLEQYNSPLVKQKLKGLSDYLRVWGVAEEESERGKVVLL